MSEDQVEKHAHPQDQQGFSLWQTVMQHRAFVLLFALLLQILLSGPDIGGRLFDLIVRIITIFAAIFMTADAKKHLSVGVGLGIPSLILLVLIYRIDSYPLDWFAYGFLVMLYLFVIRLMLRQIFNAREITVNTIGLALCTYILIGTIWVLFYTPVIALDPHAFSVPILDEGGAYHTLTYFSYITLTTLGYGDISPVSNLARNLAVLEALTGTLFLAVLISRLVGSYVSRKK